MKIASVLENQKIEKRIAITPEIAKKYISLNFDVSLCENYGNHLGVKDEEYKELGVSILRDEKEIISNSDILVQLALFDDDKSSLLKENQTFIGVLNPYDNKNKISDLAKKNINFFSLELLPRITRAQSMDILSSQANLAGYKAVVESFANFEKAIPMMMTAAGTIPAAKVLVVGAGVAGLQAIATAKRMGAIVFATDVRVASKEQVESLGGKFLTVEDSENLETEGGYAKEASEDFKKKQEELLSETLKKIDIVICTALIPGKKAPIIIKVLSIISSSRLILIFLFSLSYKFETKLNTFFAYKFDAEVGSLFKILLSPIILTPFLSTISSTLVKIVFPP